MPLGTDYPKAVETFEKAMGPSHPDLAECLDNYAGLLRETGRTAEAQALERRAEGIRQSQSKHPAGSP